MSIVELNFNVNIPFTEDVGWSTLVTRYEDGKEQRRQKWSKPKRMFSVVFRGKTKSEFDQIWDFYNARKGAFDSFYFKNSNENPNTKVIGSGDASILNFNVPEFPIPSGAITLSTPGFSYTETAHYTLTRSTGAIVFNQAPSGDLTAVYNFCRVVRFAEDKLSRELFNYQVYNGELKLLEVFTA